jgi:hypothetical protein
MNINGAMFVVTRIYRNYLDERIWHLALNALHEI